MAKPKQSSNNAVGKPKRTKAKPMNIRESLNRAADVAREIVEALGEKTRRKELLNAGELANFRAAVDALKTCRELYLRQKALAAVKADAQPHPQPLAVVDTASLVKLVHAQTQQDR